MSNVKNIEGSRDLGARLHQWHHGMDAVYALGSMFYAGHPVNKEQVEDAIETLRWVYTGMGAEDRENDADFEILGQLLEELQEAIDDPEAFNLRQSGAFDEERDFRDRLTLDD